MSELEISCLADKVFVHRWPHDTPVWGNTVKQQLDDSINKKPEPKSVSIRGKMVRIEEFEFDSLKKIGISVPAFKEECTLIFESKFGDLFAHVHITIKSRNFLEVFGSLIAWRKKEFPNNSKN